MPAQDTLFADEAPVAPPGAPLAERLRPHTLDEVVGQRHLLAAGRPLRVAFESGRLPSMILWGPPGVGKTTLARLLARATGAHFIALSAVLAGVKDIRDAVEQAQALRRAGRATVVFVDEVHRFNKSQQDAFLPHVESGLFTFIGATTENPSFEVNSALLSRAGVHVLKALDEAELGALIDRAVALLGGAPVLDAAARARVIEHADGDARRLLNVIENLAAANPGAAVLGEAELEATLGEMLRRGDKGGDIFYDTISALHKSVRGSDPDATLYWLARLLDAGMDPRYAARRLVRMASEDIGLADPRALRLALDAAEVYERLGSPEGELALAEAAVYLAVAPKSNAVYKAWGEVRELVRRDGTRPVPPHLRNAPTRLMKDLGHGAGYRYAHDEAGGYAAGETYLPEGLAARRWYEPVPRGLEQRIGQRLAELRTLDDEAKASR
ncbi:MAG: replication-associated recombination protein A [Rubrivivax sp.]|jgi:putative ATPase|nr:replication-associated recombination protein A [Betaproteobacteria bacterium]MBP6318159.1 replication-associated recombination protein A [Rubrivivax sp.]MBK7276603.1 replication-associated recombination protein A [Betaproteobacteria bacterium]MBK7458420.1 replication-associated recombination protein A [Betaproteobacteria bacterium]MBK7517166.1 replication-associated recombination protein A [Betaproteobacteria bacterium]